MTMQPCMIDNNGRPVKAWLPHMQSSEFLRDAISRNDRASECWSELRGRRMRIHAAEDVIARIDPTGEHIAPELLA